MFEPRDLFVGLVFFFLYTVVYSPLWIACQKDSEELKIRYLLNKSQENMSPALRMTIGLCLRFKLARKRCGLSDSLLRW